MTAKAKARERKRVAAFGILAGMSARDQVRVMYAAFTLLPLADRTLALWAQSFDALLKTLEAE